LILEGWKGHPRVEFLRHPYNRGKGAAIRTALDHARGRFVIIQDADLEYDPQDYPCLIEPLLRGQAEVVYGSRYLQRDKAGRRPMRLFRFGVSLLNLCVRLIYGVRLTDEATCYKAFPTSLLRRLDLQCQRFEFCPEVTAKICRLGWKILEVPIHYDPRTVQAGKKIRWPDGWEALATLWKWRRWKSRTDTVFTSPAVLLRKVSILGVGVLVQRLLGALLFTNLGAPKVRRTEQKCAERSLD
jgi:glycosyltransferase involved in cell wall biosynthesis